MITQKCAVSLAANALFMLISFVALYVCELVSENKYLGLALAAALMLLGINLTLLAKYHIVYGIIAFVLNALAFGCAACSVFLYTPVFPEIWTAAVCLGGYTLIFYSFCLATRLKIVEDHPVLWIVGVILVLAVAGIIGIVFLPETGFFQLATFSLISFTLCISTTAYRARDIKNHIFHTTVASSVLSAIAVLIALIFASDGDVLDSASFLDVSGSGTEQSTKSRNPFDYRPDMTK